MRIAIIVEGRTEKAFLPVLREFLSVRLSGNMPKLDTLPFDGPIPKDHELKRWVGLLLKQKADHVIALTDVYPDFKNAQDARNQMRRWVGEEPRFHPHAAQYDFEAWLLPYWPTIQRLAHHNRTAPSGNPESVNHNNPPSHRIQEIFRLGKQRMKYSKPRDAGRILRDNDLSVAVKQCSELRGFTNTILTICGGEKLPW